MSQTQPPENDPAKEEPHAAAAAERAAGTASPDQGDDQEVEQLIDEIEREEASGEGGPPLP